MASELVRIKVENSGSLGLAGALVKVYDDAEKILKAQGLTSAGPTPALGVFETVLEGSATPGIAYKVQVFRDIPRVASRSSIRVIT